MKHEKLTGFLPGLLLAVLLAGCFNPITVVPPKSGDPVTDPFTVDIMIGKDGSARTVAGPDSARIKGDIRNIIQLIVVNDAGEIVAFDEVRRARDDEMAGILSIKSITFGQNYHFLLLMGHWEHDGNYNYYDTPDDFRPPTLLAAGLKDLRVEGSGKITVVMWPIVVDTVFKTGSLTAGPVITAGKPGEVTLYPADWEIEWTVKRGESGNGFTDLIRAQKLIPANGTGDALKVRNKQTITRGTGLDDSLQSTGDTETGYLITLDIDDGYTKGFGRLGTAGSVNFNLEYVPFNLTAAAPWEMIDGDEPAFDLSGGGPVWIIRNGVNDEEQNGATDFTAFHSIGNPGRGTANGNGAVRFGIAPKPSDEGSELEIGDGKFLGPADSEMPEITFTTGGYDDEAEVYYAVVPHRDPAVPPDYSDYTFLDTAETGEHQKTITLTSEQAGKDYDVYVIVYKDGEVSEPVIINTLKGGEDIDWIWGGPRFVAVSGDNSSKAAWSGDSGKTWTAATMPDSTSWYSVAYGDGVFVAVSGDNSNKAAWSGDGGETWTAATMPSSTRWYSVAYGDGVFVAVASGLRSNKAAWSGDGGRTWTAATMPSSANWESVTYGGGVFVAVVRNGNKAAWSGDGGKTWTAATMPGSANWWSASYGDGVFVVAANASNQAAWSGDGGKTWTAATMPSSAGWYSMAYGEP